MQALRIILLCVVAAIVYGILHDFVTAHVCVEYFTIGHPDVFGTDSPVVLALGWGVLATWWAGLIIGVPLAIAARGGRVWPKLSAAELLRPVSMLMLVMGISALVAGLLGYSLAGRNLVYLVEPMRSRVPPERHVPFLADLWAHSASYLAGFVGGTTVIVLTLLRRRAAAIERDRTSL